MNKQLQELENILANYNIEITKEDLKRIDRLLGEELTAKKKEQIGNILKEVFKRNGIVIRRIQEQIAKQLGISEVTVNTKPKKYFYYLLDPKFLKKVLKALLQKGQLSINENKGKKEEKIAKTNIASAEKKTPAQTKEVEEVETDSNRETIIEKTIQFTEEKQSDKKITKATGELKTNNSNDVEEKKKEEKERKEGEIQPQGQENNIEDVFGSMNFGETTTQETNEPTNETNEKKSKKEVEEEVVVEEIIGETIEKKEEETTRVEQQDKKTSVEGNAPAQGKKEKKEKKEEITKNVSQEQLQTSTTEQTRLDMEANQNKDIWSEIEEQAMIEENNQQSSQQSNVDNNISQQQIPQPMQQPQLNQLQPTPKKESIFNKVLSKIRGDKKATIGIIVGLFIAGAVVSAIINNNKQPNTTNNTTTTTTTADTNKPAKKEVVVNDKIKENNDVKTTTINVDDNKNKIYNIIKSFDHQNQDVKLDVVKYKGDIFLPMDIFLTYYVSTKATMSKVQPIVSYLKQHDDDLGTIKAIWIKVKPVVTDQDLINTCKMNYAGQLDCNNLKALRKNQALIKQVEVLKNQKFGYEKEFGIVFFVDENYNIIKDKNGNFLTFNKLILNKVTPLFTYLSTDQQAFLEVLLDDNQGVLNTNLNPILNKAILQKYLQNYVAIYKHLLKKLQGQKIDPVVTNAFNRFKLYYYVIDKALNTK